jgi:hypothetical protein
MKKFLSRLLFDFSDCLLATSCALPTADTMHCMLVIRIDEDRRAHCFPALACCCHIFSLISADHNALARTVLTFHDRESSNYTSSSRRSITENERRVCTAARQPHDELTASIHHPMLWMSMTDAYVFTFRCMSIPNHARSEAPVGPKRVSSTPWLQGSASCMFVPGISACFRCRSNAAVTTSSPCS